MEDIELIAQAYYYLGYYNAVKNHKLTMIVMKRIKPDWKFILRVRRYVKKEFGIK